jgi:hypothetical protein
MNLICLVGAITTTNEVVPGFQSRENKFCSYLAAFGTILPINHSRCGSARL